MNKRVLFPLSAAIGVLPLGFLLAHVSSAQQNVTVPGKTMPVPMLHEAKNTSPVVEAADAFLATLSETQRAAVQVGLTSQLAAKWSNFPAGFVPRNGLFFRDLNPEQAAAALKVARLALSEEGFNRLKELRAADDAFAKIDQGPGGGPRGGGSREGGPGGGPGAGGPGGPPGGPANVGGFGAIPNDFGGPGGPRPEGGPGGMGGGAALFGAGNYIIAFLGKPSTSTPWMLQLGGHHLAFNLYYKGKVGTSTPYFVGVQPNTWKDAEGKTHAPLAPMRDAMVKLTHSLTPEQLAQAKLSARFDDVYIGPERDGQFPARVGVPVSQLSTTSKNLVKEAIAAWAGDSVQSAQYLKLYEKELNQTNVSYSGATALSETGDYVRIDGPHVWIEFACQGSDHYHTIWRDRETDYGAEFTFQG